MSEGVSATRIPASCKALILLLAVPLPLSIMAPACPNLFPEEVERPAIERSYRLLKAAAFHVFFNRSANFSHDNDCTLSSSS